MRLVQLQHSHKERRVAWVQEPHLVLIEGFSSLYELVQSAWKQGLSPSQLVKSHLSATQIAYSPVYEGTSDWKLLPPIDHPESLHLCLLSGTGLTHKASAENRQKMHLAFEQNAPTDSMKMYEWGLQGGKASMDSIGVAPEWFYKGNGSQLCAHNSPLLVPPYGLDGGEEPEIAGIYMIDPQGSPWRVGMATANEFSDHVLEQKNYLYLAPSKLRNCSLGPEIVLHADFEQIFGKVQIFRGDRLIWSKALKSGENHMAHSLFNLEHHHFKFSNHRIPGQLHIHFLGADAFSFGEGITLEANDWMEVSWEGLGRPLRNPIHMTTEKDTPVRVKTWNN